MCGYRDATTKSCISLVTTRHKEGDRLCWRFQTGTSGHDISFLRSDTLYVYALSGAELLSLVEILSCCAKRLVLSIPTTGDVSFPRGAARCTDGQRVLDSLPFDKTTMLPSPSTRSCCA
mmetsp:Transcript_11327/g.27885  ORF Transcript_11327/g.27885 Transcript_11327/m.27885 type:complete len:119 (+) Transcript_11327:80-436(+)